MSSIDEFSLHLRSALNHLYDPEHLAKSPLRRLLPAQVSREPALALQSLLIRAIEDLRPRSDSLLAERDQAVYELLLYRYVQRLTQEEIAHQLGVSERQLRRNQNLAIRVLADQLWAAYSAKEASGPGADDPAGDPAGDPARDESFDWLLEEGQEALTDPNGALVTVTELAEPLAQRYARSITWSLPPDIPPLAIHPVAFRQVFVIVLAHALQASSGPTVFLTARQLKGAVRFDVETARPAAIDSDGGADLQQAEELLQLFGGALVSAASITQLVLSVSVPVYEQETVLVIDDNADFIQLLRRYASGTRYRVVGFQDPLAAMGALATARPRIIVLDVMMPHIDGWEMLRKLRRDPVAAALPIIVCTMLKQPELAHALGGTFFLAKPITQADFLAALARLDAHSGTTPP